MPYATMKQVQKQYSTQILMHLMVQNMWRLVKFHTTFATVAIEHVQLKRLSTNRCYGDSTFPFSIVLTALEAFQLLLKRKRKISDVNGWSPKLYPCNKTLGSLCRKTIIQRLLMWVCCWTTQWNWFNLSRVSQKAFPYVVLDAAACAWGTSWPLE